MKRNYDKVKVCLDYKCKKYLRNVYNQINYEDNKLNKCTNISHFSIRNHYILKQLKKEFSLVSKETIQLKKSIKEFKRLNLKTKMIFGIVLLKIVYVIILKILII